MTTRRAIPPVVIGQGRYRRAYTPTCVDPEYWRLLAALIVGVFFGWGMSAIHIFGAWR